MWEKKQLTTRTAYMPTPSIQIWWPEQAKCPNPQIRAASNEAWVSGPCLCQGSVTCNPKEGEKEIRTKDIRTKEIDHSNNTQQEISYWCRVPIQCWDTKATVTQVSCKGKESLPGRRPIFLPRSCVRRDEMGRSKERYARLEKAHGG